MKHLKIKLILILFFFMIGVKAQNTISVLVTVNPPYTPNVLQYQNDPNKLFITLVNSSNVAQSIYLSVRVSGISNGHWAQTDPTQPWSGPPLLVMPGTTQLNFNILRPYIENTSYQLSNTLSNNDIRQGIVPEGYYQICVKAFDYTTRQPLSPDAPQGCSMPFLILNPQPPILIAPACGDSIAAKPPTEQQILFNWQMPQGVSMSTPLKYNFRLVELPPNTSPQLVLQSNSGLFPLIERQNLMTTFYALTPADPPLIAGRTYAWCVQAVDPMGSYILQNNGYSMVCTFKYYSPNQESTISGGFTAVYPVMNDTIPWTDFPIIHRFDPYNSNFRNYKSDFRIFVGSNEVGRYNADYNWANGPILGQSQALGMQGQSISQEHAQHIALYRPKDQRTPALTFEKGQTYRWQTQAKMYTMVNAPNSAQPALQGSPTSRFTVGMGRPIPDYPKNADTVKTGSTNFKFKTSNKPTKINPPFMIAQSGQVGVPESYQYKGGIDEKWVLEIAKNAQFNPLHKTENGVINGITYGDPNCDENCIANAVYKDIIVSVNLPDTGLYFYRIKWLKNTALENGDAYITSEVRKFRVSNNAPIPHTDTTKVDPTPPSCIAPCLSAPLAESAKVPVNTAAVGSMLTIGKFTMRVTEITWAGNAASGKGTITTPLFNAPMKVAFNGINVNSANVIFSGDVIGEYDNNSIVQGTQITTPGANNTQVQQKINACMAFINGTGRVVSSLLSGNPMGLPIGIDREVDGHRFVIGITSLKFTPEKATLGAIMSFSVPDWNSTLGLGADDICFSPQSINGGQGRLFLPGDLNFPLNDNNDAYLRVRGTKFESNFTAISDSGTYVSWDCQGFKKMVLDGGVIFSKNTLVEDISNGTVGPDSIQADFRVVLTKGWNFITRLTFNKPFQVKDVQGLGFDINEAWVDYSVSDNPDGFSLPAAYTSRFTPPNPATAWKGVYIKRLGVRLPPEFKIGNSNARIAGIGQNLIFDRRGFTGEIGLNNLITINQGSLDGWAYSLDSIYVAFAGNSLVKGSLKGNLRIPLDTASNLSYRAMIASNPNAPLTFNFRVRPTNELRATVWMATLALDTTTYIALTSGPQPGNPANRGFMAEAMINGRMSIAGNMGNLGNVNFPQMRVNRLNIKSRAPYIVADTNTFVFSHNSPQRYIGPLQTDNPDLEENLNAGSGFPISIRNVRPVMGTSPDGSPEVGLAFGTYLNLMSSSNGFAASLNMSILGKITLSPQQSYSFNRVRLDSIGIDGTIGVVSLRGRLGFYEQDPVYGNGVKGELAAEFKPTVKARVTGQFGNINDMRYWYADASVYFTPPIKVIPEQFEVFGFGGGAWYKMRRNGTLSIPTAPVSSDTTSNRGRAGTSRSGSSYIPDATAGFGFEAMMAFGSGQNGKTYNADVRLGADFNSDGGFNSFWLNGDAYFMANRNERASAPVVAFARINYTHPTNTFSANFKAKVNIRDGLIKGYLPGDTAGTIAILIKPNDWYMHFGTPQTPIGLNIKDFAQFRAYIMAGKNLPAAEPPPANVLAMFSQKGIAVINGRDGDVTSYMNGDGFAFGARFDINVPRKEFLIFYGKFNFGAGLDVSLKNYGALTCEGNAAGGPIGMNGWYTKGQMYAYFDVDIGLFVDVWVVKGEFRILQFATAAYLQCGFPNPSYFKGAVTANYNILNGLVTGNCNFEFKVGDECRLPVADPLVGVKVITQIAPGQGEQNVDCGVIPLSTFNLEVNRPFTVSINDPNTNITTTKTFKFIMTSYSLSGPAGLIVTTRSDALDGFSSELIPNGFLEPFTNHSIRLTLQAMELNPQGSWVNVIRNGQPVRVDTTVNFRTGAYPANIPESNIAFTYPLRRQRTFLKGECINGIVKMKQTMAPLFNPYPPDLPAGVTHVKFIARFIPLDGGPIGQSDVVVQGTDLRFNIPNLDNSKVYAVQILSKQVRNNPQYDPDLGPQNSIFSQFTANNPGFQGALANISANTSFSYSNAAGSQGMAQVRTTRRDARNVAYDEKLLYLYFFKTSQFSTLQEKASSLNAGAVNYFWETFSPDFSGPEKFDVYDVEGTGYSVGTTLQYTYPPLVRFVNPMTDAWSSSFATSVMYPLYQRLVNFNFTRTYLIRDMNDFIGTPPHVTANWHSNYASSSLLSQSECLPPSGNGYSSFLNNYFASGAFAQVQAIYQNYINGLFNSAPSATAKVYVYTPFQVYQDWLRMKIITNSVIAQFGQPTTDNEFYDPITRNLLNQFKNYSYQNATRGSDYRVTFGYMRIPGYAERPRFTQYTNCSGAPVSQGNKNFTY